MVDFNLRLGKGKSAEDVNLNNLKGGISGEKVDDKYKSIFNALDKTGQTEGVLEESEVNDLKSKVQNFAKNNIFSKHEAGKLLSSLGLKDVKAETFFGFLKDVVGISANIESSTTDTQGNTSVAEKQGDTSLTSVYNKNGRLKSTNEITNGARVYKEYSVDENSTKIIREENGVEVEERYKNDEIIGKSEITRDADGNVKQTAIYELVNGELKQTSGNIGEKSFTRTYATNGGYTDNYDNGEKMSYDAKGNAIAGKDAKGSYRIVNEDGRTYNAYIKSNYLENKYTYENNGNRYTLSDDEVVISCTDTECTTINQYNEEQTYDANGNLTKYTWCDKGKVFCYGENTYDTKGNLTKETKNYKNDKLVYITEYTYDVNGNKIKGICKVNGKLDSSTEYTYDANGNLTKQIDKDEHGKVTNTKECTYDANGNLTKEIENGGYNYTSEYIYDANGNLTKQIEKDKNGEVNLSLEYTYDTNGNITKNIQDWTHIGSDIFEYIYDDSGNLTKKIYKDEDGNVKREEIVSSKGFTISLTSEGDINTYAKNGESFDATMQRLGITEESDIEIFKAANKKALSRSNGGWFQVGEKEVVIPKQLVEKLNMLADTSNFVDGDRELAKWYADKRK